MKKIVALVLSLVMVLGLATTAFAAKAYHSSEMTDVAAGNTTLAGWDAKLVLADKETDDEFAVYTVELTAKKDFTFAGDGKDYDAGDDLDLWNSYGGDEFVIVDGTGTYDWAIVDGKKVTYLAAYEAYEDLGWETKATAVALPLLPDAMADVKCDTYYITSVMDLGTTFFWYEAALYAPCADADADYTFNVDGVAVKVAEVNVADTYFDTIQGSERVLYVNHSYVVEYKGNGYGAENDTKVYCENCKAEFKFVVGPEVVAVAAFGEGNYFALDTGLWVAYDAVAVDAPATEAGDKVESAETFDAGIAMYVGMSVMAAAGSAVVLKKKD